MKLTALFLADYASARDNLLHVVGGGISRAMAPSFPAPLSVSLAGLLVLDDDEQGQHRFTVAIRRTGRRGDAARVEGTFTATRKPDAPAEAPLAYVLALDLRPLAMARPGVYRITLAVDDRRLGEVRLVASLLPADAGAP